jgi:hypothetical protein
MEGHHHPNNPQNSITEMITDLHHALYRLITSPVGTVLQHSGMRMEVLPGPVYRVGLPDGKVVEFSQTQVK